MTPDIRRNKMLTIYDLNKSEEWDAAARSFSECDVYHLSGYVRAFKLHGDGEPMLIIYEGDGLRGINVVMKRDIADDKNFEGKLSHGEYFDLATPYGYGGWHFEGEQTDEGFETFCKEYTAWCKQNRIVSEFVRFHPVINNAQEKFNDFYEKVFLGNTVAIELDDEEKIWERFSSKNRGHIRVAMKEGVTVRKETSKEAFDVFCKIYETTMDHDDANSYYYFDNEFFESIRNDLEGSFTLFTAYLGDIPISSSIMIYTDRYMNYHLSGQLFEYRRYAGTNMILYEAAKWGCEHGCEWLHLGGGLGAKEGPLYDFKKSFYKKGEDKQFYIGKKITDEEAYKRLTELRGQTDNSGFFPEYRA